MLFVWTGRGSRDHSRSALCHLHLHRRASLSSACRGVCPTAAPLQEQMQAKAFALSPITAGQAWTALFKPLPPDLPSSPALAPACWGLLPWEKGVKGEGSQRTSSGNERTLLACLSRSGALLPFPAWAVNSHSLPLKVTVHVFFYPASGYG